VALLALLSGLIAAAATAQVPENFWGAPAIQGGTQGERLSLQEQQTLLLWTGFYYGLVDGQRSDAVEDAIRRFQQSLGERPTGVLDQRQGETLRNRAARAQAQADFREVRDEWTGIAAMLPMGYLSAPSIVDTDEDGTTLAFRSRGSSDLSVYFNRVENFRHSAKAVYDVLLNKYKTDESNSAVYGKISGDFFSISFVRAGEAHVRIFQFKSGEARSVQLVYPASRANIFAPVQVMVFAGIRHFENKGLSLGERKRRVAAREYPGFEDVPDWRRTMVGNGSGSLVTFRGHVLTNHHVVDGCGRLTVNGNPAVLIGVDIVNDLAVLRSESFARREPVRFRERSARLGEDVVVVGYPVFSISQALNFTTGVVSARTGLAGDRRNIQITAPVQPGNSGGPVLDRYGRQIAVVVSKASREARQDMSIENMSWVVRGRIALDFLRDHDVEPLLSRGDEPAVTGFEDVADLAKRFTVRVECHPLEQ
jgi:S1-C subfamily serine protease